MSILCVFYICISLCQCVVYLIVFIFYFYVCQPYIIAECQSNDIDLIKKSVLSVIFS